jgi:hypothetical protein
MVDYAKHEDKTKRDRMKEYHVDPEKLEEAIELDEGYGPDDDGFCIDHDGYDGCDGCND